MLIIIIIVVVVVVVVVVTFSISPSCGGYCIDITDFVNFSVFEDKTGTE